MSSRLRASTVLLAVLAVAGCSPVAASPGGSPAPAAPPVLRIMPLGDSITQGAGSTTGAGYRQALWEHLAGVDYVGSQASGAATDPDHEGHGGYTINQVRVGLDGWLAAARPDVILLHLGINDLAAGTQAGAAERLIALIDRIHEDLPTAKVLVLGLIPTTGGLQTEVAKVNAVVNASQARHNYRYVAPPALGPSEMADRLHPNDAGYQRIADAIYAELNRMELARQRVGNQP
ncbi:SGNH/GDSL hydrolase family protein [Streptomyces sp. NPDC046866]|uniref:SGNH/GDSL hydrolase family protein n=1 Tax=Streptomyces sp. NPDC046866 TaxID=3154921 RepID=UPI003452DBFE